MPQYLKLKNEIKGKKTRVQKIIADLKILALHLSYFLVHFKEKAYMVHCCPIRHK